MAKTTPSAGSMISLGTYFPTRVPIVPPIRTPGIDHATTYQTGVATSAWTAAPAIAAMASTNTLVAIATRGGSRHRTISWVVVISGRPALIRPVMNPPAVASPRPGGRQQVSYLNVSPSDVSMTVSPRPVFFSLRNDPSPSPGTHSSGGS